MLNHTWDVLGARGCDDSWGIMAYAAAACVLSGHDAFKIGERNVRSTLDYLARQGFAIRNPVVGGTVNRTIHLEIGSGAMTLKTPTASESLSLAA